MTPDSSGRAAELQLRAIRLGPIVIIVVLVFALTALLSFDFAGGQFVPSIGIRLFLAAWIAAGLVALYLLVVLLRRRGAPLA